MLTRRTAFLAGLGVATAAFNARASSLETRALSFQSLHTGEALSIEYWQNGDYAPDALVAIDRILRDHRTGEVHAIDPRLLDLLHALANQAETSAPFQVISGYRSPQTNATLADASSGVARRSLHMQGMAIDIAVERVSTDALRQAALSLGRGGVGYYPDPGFVHVDVGRVRSW
jgi:uncharacterized protein YcbK (DUF882 family)